MVTVERSHTVGSRTDLALLANDRGYKIAVEVGTDRGVFARQFLDRWLGEMLFCVDPYVPYGEMPRPRDADYHMALALLAPHISRCRMLLCTSFEAWKILPGESARPSLIYIDGAHDEVSVAQDLAWWWDLLAPGGVLAGDDFKIPSVERAVKAFADAHNLPTIWLTTDYNRLPSWFMEKPR